MQNKPECKEPDLISIKDQGSQNRYMILLLILVGVLMAVVDGSVVSIALPTITGYFHVSLAQSQWVMTSYLVTVTSLLLIFGKVAEYTGRAHLFFLGMLLFTRYLLPFEAVTLLLLAAAVGAFLLARKEWK